MPYYNAATNSYEGSGTLGARNYPSASSASSNSAAHSIAQVQAFTGTNTGNRYNVGQSYQMNGDAYTAQADGTFRNTRTGQVIEGSSNSNTATFFAAPSSSVGTGGSGVSSVTGPVTGAAAGRVETSTPGAQRSEGPGNAGAITAATGTGTGPGKPGAITAPPTPTGKMLKSPFGAGPGTAEVHSAAQRWFPSRVILDTSMPNVEDFGEPRYGEPGELVFGTANMIADLHANDKAGEVDKVIKAVVGDAIKVRPGSAADHTIQFVEQASQANWGRFHQDGFYVDKVQVPSDGGGWAPKW